MKTPREILEQEWYKKTDTPFTDQTADHLQYALDAMELYAAQFSEGGKKSNSVLHSIISESPTDEQIEAEAKARYVHYMASMAESVHGESAFIEGAAWMRDKLDSL